MTTVTIRTGLCVLALAGAAGCMQGARAQQFSADLVITHGDAVTAAGRLRVSGDKVRIETSQFPDGYFLVDGAKPAAYFVRPAAKVFMDARQSSPLTRMLVTLDPDDPCRQWQAMARVAGIADQGEWRCERRGEEVVGDRKVEAYAAVSGTGRKLIGWIDRGRRFALRIKTDDGTLVTAQNLRDEAQAAPLFEIPGGFGKFDPEALIRRIKQSDVWVDQPAPER